MPNCSADGISVPSADPGQAPNPNRALLTSQEIGDQEPCQITNEYEAPQALEELVQAIENNDSIRAGELIDQVENLNMFLPDGKALIHYAVENNNTFIAAVLCSKGADCNLVSNQDNVLDNKTPSEMAISLKLDGMFKLLIQEVGVDTKTYDDLTLLHSVAYFGGTKEMVKLCIDGGIPVDSQVLPSEQTPLHFATFADNAEVVKELLAQGARTDIKDDRGYTPLAYARDPEIKDLLCAAQPAHTQECEVFETPKQRSEPKQSSSIYGILAVVASSAIAVFTLGRGVRQQRNAESQLGTPESGVADSGLSMNNQADIELTTIKSTSKEDRNVIGDVEAAISEQNHSSLEILSKAPAVKSQKKSENRESSNIARGIEKSTMKEGTQKKRPSIT